MGPHQVWTKFVLRMCTKMHWREIQTLIKIIKLGELNELVYEDLILSINTRFCFGKVAFGLVKNGFLEGNCKVA